MFKVKINGVEIEVAEGTSILDAAKKVGVKIPTLCYTEDLDPWASCGICVVRNEKSAKLLRACCTKIEPNMSIITSDKEIVETRRTVLELILANHPNDCLQCARSGECELQTMAANFGMRKMPFNRKLRGRPIDDSTGTIVLEPDKCIQCGRCVTVCQKYQNVWAIEFLNRGDGTVIAPAGDVKLSEGPCISCGQCAAHCPVGAITDHDDRSDLWSALNNKAATGTTMAVQVAPAVRAALGEAFGLPPGTDVTKRMYAALRRLGFDVVFDTSTGADVTTMEESKEFVERFTQKRDLPMVTSCCPAWVDYLEKYYADLIPHFSTAKSPMQMAAALLKTYWAQTNKIEPAKIYSVAVMPCTAKKLEIRRDESMKSSGYYDTDLVITTRELAKMIKEAGIDFLNIPGEEADSMLGQYSSGILYGVTGGVMESALRTAYNIMTKKEYTHITFEQVRGMQGVKEAELEVEGQKIRIAIAHQMGNIAKVLDKVREAKAQGKESPWHFIEVMACRGGCVGGGGQPYGCTDEVRMLRGRGIYSDDERQTIRFSHQSPQVKKIYADFLKEPGGHLSHKLLHTHYEAKPIYKN